MVGRVAIVAAGALAFASSAAAGTIEIRRVDTAQYPNVVVTAVTPTSEAPPQVFEDGRPVEGLDLENLAGAKAVVLAIDRSQSMAGRPLAEAARAARTFVGTKRPSDRLEIVGFGSDAFALTDFSAATIDADGALRTLDVDDQMGTALYDAVVLASRNLGRQALHGRVLVLLTDGRNSGGRASVESAIRAARASRTVIYPIAITSDQLAVAPLRQLAQATGGQFFAGSRADLGAIYARIASELRRTWRVSYASANAPGTQAKLELRQAGGAPATATFVVPGTRERSSGSTRLVGRGWSALVLALLVTVLLYAAARVATRKPAGQELRQRLRGHLGEDPGDPGTIDLPRSDRLRSSFAGLVTATERRFSGLRQWRRLERLLEQAAVPLRPGELLYAALGGGLLLALVATAAGVGLRTALLLLVLTAVAPVCVLRIKARRRARAFDDQLPDLLAAVAASLRVGHSLKQALQSVTQEMDAPAKTEFGRVLAEARLGRPLDEALDAMVGRIASEDLGYVTTAVSVQEEVGGSLAGLFQMVSSTVRERHQHARKLRSLTAMGRASAYVLTFLPFALAGVITVINPNYMEPLYHTGTGHFLMLLGVGMIGVGALFLRRIVTIRG
jgi:tight adherence protein B